MADAVTGLLAVITVVSLIRGRGSSKRQEVDQLVDRFGNMATRIMDENSAKFKEAATDPMRALVADLQTDIRRLQDQSVENTTLVQALGTHAEWLDSILSNTKARGGFGEMIIEKWFDTAGLRRGVHYDMQVVLPDGSKPDFVVYMPDQRCLMLDSKVPLDNLSEAFDDGADEKKQAAMFKAHREAVKSHITALGKRKYSTQDIPAPDGGTVHSVEYVVMVVPEYALGPVMDAELIEFA